MILGIDDLPIFTAQGLSNFLHSHFHHFNEIEAIC